MRNRRSWGCSRCFAIADAAAAFESINAGDVIKQLIDQSHYDIRVLRCPACGQHSVRVFTESIDWQGGNDPQYWTVLPLRNAEVGSVCRAANVADRVEQISADGRLCLYRAFPRDAEKPHAHWSTGPISASPIW